MGLEFARLNTIVIKKNVPLILSIIV